MGGPGGHPHRLEPATARLDVQTGALFELDGEPISSTRPRRRRQRGPRDCAEVSRPFPGALGEVVHGDARGRTMGFPTANGVTGGRPPPAGVYAVEAVVDGDTFAAVANLGAGRRLTTARRASKCTCSTSTTTFTAGVEVTFKHQREQRCFDGPEDLKRQIAIDVTAARTCLKA